LTGQQPPEPGLAGERELIMAPTRARLEGLIRAAVPLFSLAIVAVLDETGRRWF
jgi:hypothetical protein